MQDCLFTIVQFWKEGAVVHQEEIEVAIPYYRLRRVRCSGRCYYARHKPEWMTDQDRCQYCLCRVTRTEVYICNMYVRQAGNTVYFEPEYHYLRDDPPR